MNRVGLEDRFLRLLTEHGKIVRKVANIYAFQYEDRRDVAQEIYAQVWKAFPGYDDRRSFTTWLYRIALNVGVSYVRGESKRKDQVTLDPQIADSIPDDLPSEEQDERVEFLHRFIEGLGSLDKALLLLYLEEHSYLQISEILGITETNVATKIARLKQRAKERAAIEKGDK